MREYGYLAGLRNDDKKKEDDYNQKKERIKEDKLFLRLI